MEKQNNKLEEFLKGRINKFDSSDSGWDRPGAHVWEQAQKQFPKYPIRKKRRPFLWFFVLLSLLLGFYSLYLHKKEITTTKTIITNELRLQEAKDEIKALKKEHETVAGLLKEKYKAVTSDIADLQVKHQDALSVIERQKNSLDQLTQTNNILETDLRNALSLVTSTDRKEVQKETNKSILAEIPKEWNQALFVSLSFPSLYEQFPASKTKLKENIAFAKIPLIVPLKRSRKPFEIGLTYGNQRVITPVYNVFKDKDVFEKEASEVVETTWMKGFHLAYQVLPNFYIKAGFQQGEGTQKKYFNNLMFYDKDGEYLNSEGKTSNDLQLDVNSPYGEFKNEMTVVLPDDAPDDGDKLEIEYSNVQDNKLIRVPLGLEYFWGKRRLQLQVQGGLVWNKLFVDNFNLEGNLYFEDEIIPFKDVKVVGDQSYQKTFTSGYIGGGLDYAFTPRWHLRATYALENHFLKGIKSDKDDLTFSTQRLDMGIFFRF